MSAMGEAVMKSPNEVGEAIRAIRERYGYSLDSLSAETKISTDVLRALEEGRWEYLGSKFLVKNFIKTYCSVFGETAENFITAVEELDESYRRDHQFAQLFYQKQPRIRNKGRLLFYVSVIFISSLMVTGGVYVFRISNHIPEPRPGTINTTEPEPGPSNIESEALTQQSEISSSLAPLKQDSASETDPLDIPQQNEKAEEKTAEVPVSNDDEGLESSLEKGDDTSFRVQALEEAWVRVWVDGQKPVSKLLEPGEELHFPSVEKVKLILGNAGGTKLIWHGKELPPPGRRGQVVRLSFPDNVSGAQNTP